MWQSKVAWRHCVNRPYQRQSVAKQLSRKLTVLRSWTRRLGIESDLRVGIAISKNHMDAVAINGTPGEWKTAWTKQHTIEPSLFAINTDRSIGSTFHEA